MPEPRGALRSEPKGACAARAKGCVALSKSQRVLAVPEPKGACGARAKGACGARAALPEPKSASQLDIRHRASRVRRSWGLAVRPGPSTLLTYPQLPPYTENKLSLGGWISSPGERLIPPWTFLKSSLRRLKTVQRGAKTRQDVSRCAKMRPRGH